VASYEIEKRKGGGVSQRICLSAKHSIIMVRKRRTDIRFVRRSEDKAMSGA